MRNSLHHSCIRFQLHSYRETLRGQSYREQHWQAQDLLQVLGRVRSIQIICVRESIDRQLIGEESLPALLFRFVESCRMYSFRYSWVGNNENVIYRITKFVIIFVS